MLRFTDGQTRVPAGDLSPEESEKVHRAFGCSPELSYRPEARAIVKSHRDKGRWLLCDCRPDQKRPPTLFPTVGGHIEREDRKGKGTPHHEDCVFARGENEQFKIVTTYRQRDRGNRIFTLLRESGEGRKKPPSTDPVAIRYVDKRPGEATLLFELLDTAGLNRIYADEPIYKSREDRHDTEVRLLRETAAEYFLAPGQPVSEWLATSAEEFWELCNKIKAGSKIWKRPYGVFVKVFPRIDGKKLFLKRADKIDPDKPDKPFATITGSFKVFAEKTADVRPPYLVIGVVALADKDASNPEIIRAYAHPCMAWDRMFPVDSDYERKTLDLLMECKEWLGKKRNAKIAIKKPLFDVSPITDQPHDIIKPDFIISNRKPECRHPTIIIETMGTDDPVYRQRKERLHPIFQRVGKGDTTNPVIEHDCANREKKSKDLMNQLDQNFKKDVFRTVLT